MSYNHGLDPSDRLKQATVQFRIIVSGNEDGLESQVNEHLMHGWELHGDTHFFANDYGQSYTQAVIKRPFPEREKVGE